MATPVSGNPQVLDGSGNPIPGAPQLTSSGSIIPGTGTKGANSYVANQSTTTLSNANKIAQVPINNVKLDTLSNKGITSDENGNNYYSNGTQVAQPTENSTQQLPYTTADTSSEDQQTKNIIDQLMSTTDSNTASQIQNIQSQFAVRDQLQQQINNTANKNVNNALLMGGATGQGSSAQFAPISSSGIIQSQESYGVLQLSNLDAQENNLIAQAQQANYSNKFALQEKLLDNIDKVRQQKYDLAAKINDQVLKTNQTLQEQKIQSDIDNSIANVYSQGVTDPTQILSKLKSNGVNVTADQISKAIKNIANNNGIDTSTLDSTSKLFFALKSQPGGLPASILNLPDTASQLTKFIQMYQQATAAGKALGAQATPGPVGTINGYDITSYATDPNHETAVTNIYNNLPNITDAVTAQTAINQLTPGSQVTGQMVIDAATKANVDPKLVLALMQQDSSLGTKGKAVQTNNPGNVGNDDTGATKTFPTIQAGVDAVADWLSNHKVQPPSYAQYGLLANTDFNPQLSTDKTANAYLTQYLKNGVVPSPTQLGISTRSGLGTTQFGNAQTRAGDLYYQATGQSLPSPEILKGNLTLINGNNKLLNNIGIQTSTIGKNFDLAVQNLDKSNLNKNIQPINSFIDSVKNTLGDPDIAQYFAQNATLSNEVGSLLALKNATGTTVHDKLESAGLINNKMSADQEIQVIKTILQEAHNASDAVTGQNKDLYSQIDPLQQDSNNPNRDTSLTAPLVSGTTHSGVSLPGNTSTTAYQGVNLPH